MSHKQPHTRTEARPWYVRDRSVDEYKEAIRGRDEVDEPTMKRKLTVVRSIIVNIGIIGLSAYGLMLGGDTTWITVFALAVLAGYNGVEASELSAFLQAFQEVQAESADRGEDDD